MPELILTAYARSDTDGDMLRPHVKSGMIIFDRGEHDAGARIIRSTTNPGMIILIAKTDVLPPRIADDIIARGGRVVTLDDWLPKEIQPEISICTPEELAGEAGGEAGKNTPLRERLPDQVRQAIGNDLRIGRAIKAVAREYGVDPASVRRIKKQIEL